MTHTDSYQYSKVTHLIEAEEGKLVEDIHKVQVDTLQVDILVLDKMKEDILAEDNHHILVVDIQMDKHQAGQDNWVAEMDKQQAEAGIQLLGKLPDNIPQMPEVDNHKLVGALTPLDNLMDTLLDLQSCESPESQIYKKLIWSQKATNNNLYLLLSLKQDSFSLQINIQGS